MSEKQDSNTSLAESVFSPNVQRSGGAKRPIEEDVSTQIAQMEVKLAKRRRENEDAQRQQLDDLQSQLDDEEAIADSFGQYGPARVIIAFAGARYCP